MGPVPCGLRRWRGSSSNSSASPMRSSSRRTTRWAGAAVWRRLRADDGPDSVAADDRGGLWFLLARPAAHDGASADPLARFAPAHPRGGPITVADYMADCLLHPVHGYYTTRDPFGAGRFHHRPRNQPDVRRASGLCLAQAWLDQGAPAPFTLAELGPGRGTLMADMLRATGRAGLHAAAQVVLVEASPTLRAVQARTLRRQSGTWIDGVEALPDRPLFLLANEFFDALPIRQFQRARTAGSERMVGAEGGGCPSACPRPCPWPGPWPIALPRRPPGTSWKPAPSQAAVALPSARSRGTAGGALHRLWRLAVARRHAAGAAPACLRRPSRPRRG
jgi:hypothetical protein